MNQTTDTASETASDPIEQGVVAFAAQLGTLVGSVEAKTQGWLDRESLGNELTRIRDGAAQLIDQLTPRRLKRAKTTSRAKRTTKAALAPARSRRGLVDAPGKQHRKPPPQVKAGKHASEPKARVIGNPGLKTGRRGGRG